MHLWHDVSVGENIPEEITVIIEINKGSRNKYEIDKETGLIKLDRVFYGAAGYPVDYGFVPQTLWDDGDAFDAMVLTSQPLFPGCLLKARPVGVIRMIDGGEGDDKILCVPVKDPRMDQIADIKDVNPHTLKEIQDFLENYKNLEGKKVEITGMDGVEEAKEAVKKGIELYNQKFSK